ncbi:MAG: hypothetical protein DRP79_02715 [Planctomycetota bacterium]|nr:MAG: hypothetical protein DRP79_02715 [Planctomycetota bacterium]
MVKGEQRGPQAGRHEHIEAIRDFENMRKCTRHIIKQLVKIAMNKTLSREEQIMLEEHLKICPDCREMAEQMYAERAARDKESPARLTGAEREELKSKVLERIKEVEPDGSM